MKRLAAMTVAVTMLAGCASTQALGTTPRLSADLGVRTLTARTRFETEDPKPPPAADTPKRPGDGTKPAFWTGVAALSLGVAGSLAFGIAGEVTEQQLKDGYDDADLSRSREQELADRGEIFNGLTVGGVTLALAGLATMLIAYGIDHSRCGPLTRGRIKRCRDHAK